MVGFSIGEKITAARIMPEPLPSAVHQKCVCGRWERHALHCRVYPRGPFFLWFLFLVVKFLCHKTSFNPALILWRQRRSPLSSVFSCLCSLSLLIASLPLSVCPPGLPPSPPSSLPASVGAHQLSALPAVMWGPPLSLQASHWQSSSS